MAIIKAQISLVNVNDGIITGSQPTNPIKDTLWLDSSVTPNPMLKQWDGSQWVDIGEMSPTLTDSINSINQTLSNMTDDSLLDFKERQQVKQDISNIIGFVISDQTTTLPTQDTLDTSDQGSFYQVRRSALNSGISAEDTNYTNLTNAYNTLKTYLEGLVPLPWDAGLPNRNSTITIDSTTYRTNWINYYLAEDVLRTATSQQLNNNITTVSNNTQDQITALGTRMTNAETMIQPDNITNTVMSNTSYTAQMAKKADSSALGDYVTNDQLTQATTDANNYADQQIKAIDYTPYVTQSQLTQTSNSITAKFGAGGGANLVKNSVGFSQTDFWTVTGTVKTVPNDELIQLGFGSGFTDSLGVSGSIAQTIYTIVGQSYTLSFYMRKDTDATTNAQLGIYIYDANNNLVKLTGIDTNMGTTTGYQKFTYTWQAATATHQIQPYFGTNTTGVITGIMVNIGDTALVWSMATGELYTENTKLDMNGVTVSQTLNGIETGRTVMRPTKFAGFYDVNGDGVIDESTGSPDEVFRVDKDEFVMKKATISQEITMGKIKVVLTSSGAWAFVSNSQ